jgi:hypothetical protein
MAKRGPLCFIVLAATGQDMRQCEACECCYVRETLEDCLDVAIWEVFAAACKDDPAALTSRTICVLAEAGPGDIRCVNGLDVPAIARALCREAELRGVCYTQVDVGRERCRR